MSPILNNTKADCCRQTADSFHSHMRVSLKETVTCFLSLHAKFKKPKTKTKTKKILRLLFVYCWDLMATIMDKNFKQ